MIHSNWHFERGLIRRLFIKVGAGLEKAVLQPPGASNQGGCCHLGLLGPAESSWQRGVLWPTQSNLASLSNPNLMELEEWIQSLSTPSWALADTFQCPNQPEAEDEKPVVSALAWHRISWRKVKKGEFGQTNGIYQHTDWVLTVHQVLSHLHLTTPCEEGTARFQHGEIETRRD